MDEEAMAFSSEKKRLSLRERQRAARLKGEPYMTQKKSPKPGRLPPSNETICNCKQQCREIVDIKRKITDEFLQLDHIAQGNYLFGLVDLIPVGRRRFKTYDVATESRRQTTVCYTVPNGEGSFAKVCKKTVMDIFGIKSSKRLETIVKKKKNGETLFKDKRGGVKSYKYTFNDRQTVRVHINSFPRDESHYGRNKSNKEYLSPDLNVTLMFKAFSSKYPDSHVKLEFYRKVFRKDFNLSFKRPRVDKCKTCDLIHIQSNSPDIVTANKAKKDEELHKKKAESAYEAMNTDAIESAMPNSKS